MRFCACLRVFHIFEGFLEFLSMLACFGRAGDAPGLFGVAFGTLLGRSWGCLGRSWGGLGRSWALLGRSWEALGALLGPCWACLAKKPENMKKNHFLGANLGPKMEAQTVKNRC